MKEGLKTKHFFFTFIGFSAFSANNTVLKDTYHTFEDKQNHGSCNLDYEDDQHNTEELRGERIIRYMLQDSPDI